VCHDRLISVRNFLVSIPTFPGPMPGFVLKHGKNVDNAQAAYTKVRR